MATFQTTLTLDAVGAYPAANAPSVTFPFIPKTIMVIAEGPVGAGFFASFDGVTDAARLSPGTPSAGLVFERQHVQKMWFKRQQAVTGVVAQIIAEG